MRSLSFIFIIFLFISCGSESTISEELKKCESDLNCLNGEHCSKDKECVKDCTTESCNQGEECNSETKECEKLTCEKNSDCDTGFFCDNQTCKTKEYSCASNNDCFQAYECKDEKCTLINSNECNQDIDCPELPLPINCIGHWSCEDHNCTPVCDTNECGNYVCEENLGENFRNCPQDCRDEHCDDGTDAACDMIPPICNDNEILAHINYCYQCVNPETCKANEYQCSENIDCLDEEWNIRCSGHWNCENNQCIAECDYDLCGDKFCDKDLGESPSSCSMDCKQTADCRTDQDCERNEYCTEDGYCKTQEDTCGDQFCDESIGENEETCAIDCQEFNFCIPGILECEAGFVCIETTCVEQ